HARTRITWRDTWSLVPPSRRSVFAIPPVAARRSSGQRARPIAERVATGIEVARRLIEEIASRLPRSGAATATRPKGQRSLV
ncbi:MAG: hypothetical protein ACRDPA_12350, partial [Solirubrobacteraceae bacterium]